MKKLLHQSLTYYSSFALLMLLLTAPAFYWISQKLHLDDVDEAILLRKEEFLLDGKWDNLTYDDIVNWNEFNRDIKILSDTMKVERGKIIQQVFYDELANEWEPYRVLYEPIRLHNHPYVLMIRINLIESVDLMQATALIFTFLLSILLVGFVLITRIVSSRLWKPFYSSISLIDSFEIGKKALPDFNQTSTLEFEQLNQALVKLISQNIKALEREKEFTQNASHELQTPVAIIQTKLDLLLQSPGLTEGQANILQQLYEATSRLFRINKNLLLLAKIENTQFSNKQKVNVLEIIRDVLPYFEEQAEEKSLVIHTDQLSDRFVKANKGLTEILINNLIMNAIRYNICEGSIIMTLSRDAFVIENTGNPQPLDADSIFRRFSGSVAHPQGAGLGLAIVKKIADLHHWKAHYAHRNGKHVFSVIF